MRRRSSSLLLLLALAACEPAPDSSSTFDPRERRRPTAGSVSAIENRSRTALALQRTAMRLNGPADPLDEPGATSGELFDGSRRRADLILARLGAPAPAVPAGWRDRDAVASYLPDGRRRPAVTPLRMPPPEARPVGDVERGGSAVHGFDAWQRRVRGHVAEIIDRAGWNARRMKSHPGGSNPNRVTVHHTAGHQQIGRDASIRQMYDYQHLHMYRPDGSMPPWVDIGYHFVIDGAGRVLEGRPDNVIGAHAENGNANNTGIALMGDFNRDVLTQAQADSLASLITYLALRYDQDPTAPNFILGHKHYRGGGNGDCPGRHASDYLAELRQRVVAAFVRHRGGDNPEAAAFRVLQRLS